VDWAVVARARVSSRGLKWRNAWAPERELMSGADFGWRWGWEKVVGGTRSFACGSRAICVSQIVEFFEALRISLDICQATHCHA